MPLKKNYFHSVNIATIPCITRKKYVFGIVQCSLMEAIRKFAEMYPPPPNGKSIREKFIKIQEEFFGKTYFLFNL